MRMGKNIRRGKNTILRTIGLTMLVLCVFILSVSCTTPKGSSIVRNYHQGMLSPDIVNPLPQDKVYEGRPFYIPFQLVNNAAYPLENVVVTYEQVDSTYLDLYTPGYPLSGKIDGVGPFNPEAVPHDVAFDGAAKYLKAGTSYQDTIYWVKTKFNSKFSFAPTVCVGSSSFDIDSGSGCKVGEGPTTFSGQGAPVGVTKMEQIAYGQFGPQIEFRMTISNRGPGDLLKMKMGTAMVGSETIRCTFPESTDPEGTTVELKQGQKETAVLCIYNVAGSASYKTPLSIDFDYTYEFSKKYNLRIMKAGRVAQ